MSTTTVEGREITPADDPIGDAIVSAVLVSPYGGAYLSDHTTEVVTAVSTGSASDGTWSLELTPQSEMSASGTYYRLTVVTAAGRLVYAIVVPVSATPVPVGSILVDPTTLTPLATSGMSLARAIALGLYGFGASA